MASCFQHINECLYVVKSQLRSHWAKDGEKSAESLKICRDTAAELRGRLAAVEAKGAANP